MKKINFKKAMAVALAIPMILGAGNVAHATEGKVEDAPKTEVTEPTVDEALKAKKEEAIANLQANGVTSKLLLDQVRAAKTIEGVDSLTAELLASHKASNPTEGDVDKTPEEGDKDETPTDGEKDKTPEKDKEEIVEDNEEHGYLTEANAKAAAEAALKNDQINKSYTITKAQNGRFFYALSANEKDGDKVVETPDKNEEKDDKKDTKDAVVDPKATEETFDFDKGFVKKEDAIKQAEALIKNSKINKGYNISKGADGKYYIQLTAEPNKTEGVERKDIKKDDKKGKPAKKGHTNPKTGVASSMGVFGLLSAASAAYAEMNKRK